MDKYAKIRAGFRQRIEASQETIIIPGIYDALSAKLAQDEGFPAVYLGSYAMSASLLGQPDIGVITLTEAAQLTRSIARAVDVPVIADAEGGWNLAANIWRTVSLFEESGAAGIHIEDHESGKHTQLPAVIAPLPAVVAKIQAALEARSDPNFLIIARTDVAWASADLDEVVRRLNAFSDAGADIVMPAGINPVDLRKIRRALTGRVLITDTVGKAKKDEIDAGADLVLYYGHSLFVAYSALRESFRQLKAVDNADEVAHGRLIAPELEAWLDYQPFSERMSKYGRSEGAS